MRKVSLVLAAFTAVIISFFFACKNETKATDPEPILSQSEMIQRGEYLVTAIGCDDCHSPKKMGPNGPEIIPELRLSGYPADRAFMPMDTGALNKGWMLFGPDLTTAAGPWGVSFSANLTSDGTGIGNWNEGNFITAIRKGKAKGVESGRSLLPPMPWYNFARLTDADLKSIFAYLKTINPVHNVVPAPLPPLHTSL